MTHRTRTGLLATLLAVGVFNAPVLAQVASNGNGRPVEQMHREWAIAPKGAVLPEGTVILSNGERRPSAPPSSEAKTVPESSQGIPYTSGGVGFSEREELARVKSHYNLRLLFAARGGAYLSDIQVRVDELGGRNRLTAVSQGPWFYLRLPPGRYNLTLDNAGQVQTRRVTVPAHKATEQSFYWPRQ